LNLDEVFGAEGGLAERLPGFTYRAAQQRMAELVVAALESGRHAVIEAGTGIGKTFAYLLPVLLLERRAIISTGTHTLQDQLFDRDLPLLGAVVGRPMEVAVLKGRGNYLCWQRLDMALRDGTRDATTVAALQALDAWSTRGARAVRAVTSPSSKISPRITPCARKSRPRSITAWGASAPSSTAASSSRRAAARKPPTS
jgi:ATP-dependent DNA helicase DinG